MSNFFFDPGAEIEGEDQLGSGDFQPMPPGVYRLEVEATEPKRTKAGGSGLNLTMRVVSGEHAGRKVWQWINITHPTSVKAAAIGQREMRDLCRAVGHTGPLRSPDDLCGIPFTAELRIEPGRDGYEARNRVRRFIAPKQEGGKYEAPQRSTSSTSGGSWV
jgi:hypothetical protein